MFELGLRNAVLLMYSLITFTIHISSLSGKDNSTRGAIWCPFLEVLSISVIIKVHLLPSIIKFSNLSMWRVWHLCPVSNARSIVSLKVNFLIGKLSFGDQVASILSTTLGFQVLICDILGSEGLFSKTPLISRFTSIEFPKLMLLLKVRTDESAERAVQSLACDAPVLNISARKFTAVVIGGENESTCCSRAYLCHCSMTGWYARLV